MAIKFNVGNITSVPEHKGVYAWYLKPQLSRYDINKLISKIENDAAAADKLVEDFLSKYIFSPLKETPYKVTIDGKLKPKYTGEAIYENPSSSGLISRLSKDPSLLFHIKKVFESLEHDFLSPIYIGMAKNLRVRLSKHVNLMKHLRETEASLQYEPSSSYNFAHIEEAMLDHKFAHEVIVQRKLNINDLEVHIMKLEVEEDIQVDVENILNRLNYPLCGRN